MNSLKLGQKLRLGGEDFHVFALDFGKREIHLATNVGFSADYYVIREENLP